MGLTLRCNAALLIMHKSGGKSGWGEEGQMRVYRNPLLSDSSRLKPLTDV